jgi:hypothetical protein
MPQFLTVLLCKSCRLYVVSLDAAAEVARRTSLDPATQRTVSKRLVANLDDVRPSLRPELRSVVDFGAATFGPTLEDGRRSVLLIQDDDFNDRGTAFVWLRVQTAALRSASK